MLRVGKKLGGKVLIVQSVVLILQSVVLIVETKAFHEEFFPMMECFILGVEV